MRESKKGKFSDKGKAILGQNKVTGLGDFLGNTEDGHQQQNINTEIRQTVQTAIRTDNNFLQNGSNRIARADFRWPEELSEKLRQYAFDKRRTKTEVVIQALEEFFAREGY